MDEQKESTREGRLKGARDAVVVHRSGPVSSGVCIQSPCGSGRVLRQRLLWTHNFPQRAGTPDRSWRRIGEDYGLKWIP